MGSGRGLRSGRAFGSLVGDTCSAALRVRHALSLCPQVAVPFHLIELEDDLLALDPEDYVPQLLIRELQMFDPLAA
jgi:hypothetical protein